MRTIKPGVVCYDIYGTTTTWYVVLIVTQYKKSHMTNRTLIDAINAPFIKSCKKNNFLKGFNASKINYYLLKKFMHIFKKHAKVDNQHILCFLSYESGVFPIIL